MRYVQINIGYLIIGFTLLPVAPFIFSQPEHISITITFLYIILYHIAQNDRIYYNITNIYFYRSSEANYYVLNTRYPAALVFGCKINGQIIHVVVGMDDFVHIVTAYYPNLEKFEADLKTRRRS